METFPYFCFLSKKMTPHFRLAHLLILTLVVSMALSARAFPTSPAEVPSSGPVITAFTPSTIIVGDTAVIEGSGFDSINLLANKVFFVNAWFVNPGYEYDTIQADLIAVTDTTLSATVPLGASWGAIIVSVNDQFATSPSPLYYSIGVTLDSFTPDTGNVGDTITITGTGFETRHPAANYVWFTNGNNTNAISATPTSIGVIVPMGTTTGPVTVFTSTPKTTSTFNFNILPAIESIGPFSGRIGTEISIYGSGFDPALASEYHLTFNGEPAMITLIASSVMRVVVPTHATSGPVQLVYNNAVMKGSGIYFIVDPTRPIISGYTPDSGTIGSSLVIHGSMFDQGGPPLTVTFKDGVVAEIDSFTNQAIYTKVPLGAQTGQATVTAGGTSSDGGPGFRVIETILNMEPRNARVGDTIVVSGNGFVRPFPDYYKIQVGNTFSFTIIRPISVTDTTLLFVVPSSASYSFAPIIYSDYYLGVNIHLPLLSIMPVITRIEPDTVIAHREMEIEVHGTGYRNQFFKGFETVFSDSIVQRVTSQNTDTSFVTTVPQTVSSGTASVTVRMENLTSLGFDLVVLPDTFPYIPRHPRLFATDVTTTSLKLSWDSGYRTLGYLLDIATDFSFSTFLPGYRSAVVADTFKIVSGLEPGTIYACRLRPYSDTDTAAYDGPLWGVITLPSAPVAAPAREVSAAGFICSWSRVKGADGYVVEASENSFNSFITADVPDTAAIVSIIGLPPASVSYRVRAWNASGLSDYSNIITTSLTITGAENDPGPIVLYPNPAKDQIFISGLHEAVTESRLVGANGNVTTASLRIVTKNTYGLDIRTLPNGLYILQLVVNQKVIQLKFTKQ